ncbi:OmpA family protein [Nocardiopsis halotolerans]|uniref:OmpA family protein n=1 Tax=Nocardiopsis halotolerans TaxID=124252 RepID=UPI000344C973|nr:OmpA family protein [Nocardiopsis halotolerans]
MTHIRRLSAVLLAATVLAGIPYLLIWHLPWPETPGSWAVAAAHLRGWRLPPGVPVALLTIALWALWGLYTAGLAVEAVARLRGAPRRLRPLGPLQVVAAAAVGTVAVAPATAFADTAPSPEQREGEADGDTAAEDAGGTSAPVEESPGQAVERVRTVAGFAINSAELTDQMREDLVPVAELIAAHGDPDAVVRITGHTDPSGSASVNMELSELRARSVADHLTETLGEDAPDVEVNGVGSGEPRDGGAAAQRRVEVAYTVVPQRPTPVQPSTAAAEAEDSDAGTGDPGAGGGETDPVEAEDGGGVLVVEIPDGAVTGAVAFAGLTGGYLLGKRGVRVPRVSLSLPRLSGAPRRLALTAPPPRPTPKEDIDERVTVELDHVPGLGITGPGSVGAARRLIVNALDRLDHDAVRVLLTEVDAIRVMGEEGRDLLRSHPCDTVRMVGTMEEALTVLQRELHEETDERRPPLALVAAPDPRHETALSGLLLHGQRRGVTAVILGRWPLGGSCVIEEDGLITETSPPLNPVFHCSWPGSTVDQVMDAIRAYRHSSPALEGGSTPPRAQPDPAPEAVKQEDSETVETSAAAETSDASEVSEAFETPFLQALGEREGPSGADSPEADRSEGDSSESGPAKDDSSEGGFWDADTWEADIWETDFWEETPRKPRKAERSETEPRASEPTAPEPASPEPQGERPAPSPSVTSPVTPHAPADRTGPPGRVNGTTGRPVREKAGTGRTATATATAAPEPEPGLTPAGTGTESEDTGEAPPSRTLPRKPKKAGRGRSWRPRERG